MGHPVNHFLKTLRSVLLAIEALLVVGGVALAPCAVRAQSGIGDIVYTVGTVTVDSHGRNWAYVLWQATQPGLISNRVFAVYAKAGGATNNAPYTRLSVVKVQTDARVIEPLLQRAENLGDDLNQLQDELNQLFGSFMPASAITRAERLSAVIRGSLGDPQHYQYLLLLARNHPGINLCLGYADAELIGPGLTTFEIRAFDPATDKDLAVIGRVTVEAGNPTMLPPPGPPVLVPESSAMGDLNVKLRWGTPDNLRRLGLMQFGFDLFRVAKGYADSQGWNTTSRPPLTVLTNLIVNNPAVAKRVNRAPITPSKQFSIPEAADLFADSKTAFIMDDDGRGRPGYINYGFSNGMQFYYYVAARDVLSRDGIISTGLLATVCDRMPPLPPTGVHVLNDYQYNPMTQTSAQVLRIAWNQNPNTNDFVTNYWIYRWTNVAQMNALSGDPSNNLIGVVAHIPGATTNSFLDDGSGSPSALGAYGETFWYSVRAGDAGACGQNLSGPAGPAYGVLRQRVGPAAGTGYIIINCLRPVVNLIGTVSGSKYDPTNYNIFVGCAREDSRFDWAEFVGIATFTTASGGSTLVISNYIGRFYFNGASTVTNWWSVPRAPNGQQYSTVNFEVWCQAALSNGKLSGYRIASFDPFNNEQFKIVAFDAVAQSTRTIPDLRKDPNCREHDPGGGTGGTGVTNSICVHVTPSVGSKEYRIYRRVDDGPLSLLAAGAITNGMVSIDECDNAMPVNGGTMCFYVQLLDENGNPSPLTDLGCVDVAPFAPLPVPVLSKIESSGDVPNPGMKLLWFCPPYGVERFEVRVAGLPMPPNTNGLQFCSLLSSTNGPPVPLVFTNGGTNLSLPFYQYVTPKVGPGFGNNGAVFQVIPNVELGKHYYVTVRALGKNGNASDYGNFEDFVWSPTNAPSPEVPWPARPLPPATPSFFALAYFLSPNNTNTPVLQTAGFEGNGILLGAAVFNSRTLIENSERVPILNIAYNPMDSVETNAMGESIMPCVLYRYQVPNANFPSVSGDTIQVSPLMENIAYQISGTAGQQATYIHDPFVTVTTSADNTHHYFWLWLKDTQPVVSGARYKYILVRFKGNHEIDQLIPSNEVEVP